MRQPEKRRMKIDNKELRLRMSNATIGIGGLGGLGSNVAVALARTGVGKLILVDFDEVEESNLNRQQYFLSQVGILKTTALKENLLAINPEVEPEIINKKITSENFGEIFKNADIVAECLDSAEAKTMFIHAFFKSFGNETEKKLVAVSGLAGCGPADEIVSKKINNNFVLIGDGKSDVNAEPVLLASRVGIAALYQANQIVRWILKLND